MALVLNDRVKETTTSTGTGTVNLAGAETGFETFVAGIGNTNTTYYAIVHQSADEFEVGLGTVSDSSPDTLSRTTIISSSNSDSAVNFSAGTKDVFCTLPASKSVFADSSGNVGIGTGSPSKKFHVKGDEILLEDPQGGYKLELNADANPVLITANDNTGANYCGFRLRTNNGGGSPVTAMHVYPSGGAFVGFGTDARTDTQMVVSKTPASDTQTTPETVLILSNPCLSNSSDIKVGQGPRIVFEIPDDQSGNKATGAAIAALKEVDSDTNSQTSLAFYTSDDDETLDQNMTILSDGKVGIGTTSPDVKLDVRGEIAVDYNATYGLRFYNQPRNNWSSIGNIDTSTGANMVFKTGSGEAVRILDSGRVGVGETAPDNLLHVNSGTTNVAAKFESTDSIAAIQFTDNSGSAEIGCSGTSNTFYPNGVLKMYLDASGNLVAAGNITAYGSMSDEKLKENIEIIKNPIEKIKNLKGVNFTYKKDGKKSTGLIAQDLEKVLPEAVYTAKDLEDEEHLAIRYGNTVGLLVEAIKEQQEQIETLTARVKELEGK